MTTVAQKVLDAELLGHRLIQKYLGDYFNVDTLIRTKRQSCEYDSENEEVLIEVKTRNIPFTKFNDAIMEKTKHRDVMEWAKQRNKTPYYVMCYKEESNGDNYFVIVNLNEVELNLTPSQTIYAPKSTVVDRGKKLKECYNFREGQKGVTVVRKAKI